MVASSYGKRAGHVLAPLTMRLSGNKVIRDVEQPVHDSEWLVRDGPGRAKCTVCNRRIANDVRGRTLHLASQMHKRNLEARKNGQGR